MANYNNQKSEAEKATGQKLFAAKRVANEDMRALLHAEAGTQVDTKTFSEDRSRDYSKVINFVRKYYREFGILPSVRLVVRRTGISLRCLRELCPQGYTKDIYRSAGIAENAIWIANMKHAHSG